MSLRQVRADHTGVSLAVSTSPVEVGGGRRTGIGRWGANALTDVEHHARGEVMSRDISTGTGRQRLRWRTTRWPRPSRLLRSAAPLATVLAVSLAPVASAPAGGGPAPTPPRGREGPVDGRPTDPTRRPHLPPA